MSDPVQILALPNQSLAAGQTYGPYTSAAIAAAYSVCQLQITPGTSWPAGDPDNPAPVLQVYGEYSRDGGTTWGAWFDATLAAPQPTVDKRGNPLTAVTINFGPWKSSGQVVTSAETDMLRVTLNALQACAPQIVIAGIP